MADKEIKDLEYIVDGMMIETVSVKDKGEDAKKRMASYFIMVRKMTGMNRKQFAEWLGIPYRTMQDWELGTSQVPDYVLRLVAYEVLNEKWKGAFDESY